MLGGLNIWIITKCSVNHFSKQIFFFFTLWYSFSTLYFKNLHLLFFFLLLYLYNHFCCLTFFFFFLPIVLSDPCSRCSLGSSPLRRSWPSICDVASCPTSPSAGFWPPARTSTPAGTPPALHLHWTSGWVSCKQTKNQTSLFVAVK